MNAAADNAPDASLPELAAVPWRRRASEETLRRRGRLWSAWTASHVITFAVTAAALVAIEPWLFPMSLACLGYAWVLLELYAARAANTLRPKSRAPAPAERVAQGLLGDLLGHEGRDLQRETGLALERGRLGVWLVAEGGAALVVPGGGRVHCFCATATDPELPASDRIAHLLLALRSDERGFATVANHAFSGAPWRLRRRLPAPLRPALDAATAAA